MIFHNLKGYGVKISVIPNGLEKYMAFTMNKNLVLIDSMQFMNCSLDKLVKNLSDEDFKYLSEEFSDEELKLVIEKGIYPYEYMNSFKRFNEDELPDQSKFFSSLKDSMLKMTGVELEKISNIDVHNFIEKEMRGGISYISKRYAKVDDSLGYQ